MRPAAPGDWIVPDWPVAAAVRALFTTRSGGVSSGSWGAGPGLGGGMNLGTAAGDRPQDVLRNREILQSYLPAPPRWLALEHGARVTDAASVGTGSPAASNVVADAAVTASAGVVCCVTVADCLPVFLADTQGRAVAVAHAGWRGLAAGVLQACVAALRARVGEPDPELVAFLGPCIGPGAFEVGPDVLEAMRAGLPDARSAFRPMASGKFLADLPALARQALAQQGVDRVLGGRWCTVSDPGRFYSFRRDRITGRHAALIWIEPPP